MLKLVYSNENLFYTVYSMQNLRFFNLSQTFGSHMFGRLLYNGGNVYIITKTTIVIWLKCLSLLTDRWRCYQIDVVWSV